MPKSEWDWNCLSNRPTFTSDACTSFTVSSFWHKSEKSMKAIPCFKAQSSTAGCEATTRATQ